jgi:HEAT repeat protein
MALIKPQTPFPDAQFPVAGVDSLADLLTTLNEPAPPARRWAARNLAAFTEAVPDLLAALMQETDASVREALLISLTEIGNAEAVAGLVECLRKEDVVLRNAAIDAMRSLPGAVAPIMKNLLTDPDADVRIFSVNILESLRHPDVEQWLIDVIGQDPHVNVCATAVDLLGEVGSSKACTALEALRSRFPDEPYIEFATRLALTRIREA